MEKESEQLRVILSKENTAAVRDISVEEDRSVPKVVNRMVAEMVLKRAVKSLPSKKSR